jgi:hypothetical protein
MIRIKLLAVFFLGLISFNSLAQAEGDLIKFLNGGKDDASKLIGAYLTPVVNATSHGMTSGWYHTAKAHKSFGFDLGVTVSAVFIPSSDETFSPSTLGLKTLSLASTTGPAGLAPTITGPTYSTKYSADPDGSGPLPAVPVVDGPEGIDLKGNIGLSAVPVPMIQLGIGIIKNTDLKIRYIPELKRGSSTFNMIGFGVLHDIKQHIKGVKELPFDLSALVAFNSISGSTSFANSNPSDDVPDNTDGKMSYKLNAWLIQGIISKKISVLTLYAGLGYGTVGSNVSITGTYRVTTGVLAGTSITNPFANDYSNSSLKFTTGLRLKFGPVYFNGDYTLQKYNALTVGFGFSVL